MAETFQGLVEAAQRWLAQHPDLGVDTQRFAALAHHVPARDMDDEALGGVALGIAAATGAPRAIRRFESVYFARAKTALSRMGAPIELADDALGQTIQELFVSKGESRPRIIGLLGKGDLHGLVKVVAVRRYLNILRSRRARPDVDVGDREDDLATVMAREPGPELGALVEERRDLLKDALGAALSTLPPDSRSLLRLSIVHGLSIDELSGMFAIHRSTAARRLVSIRESLRTGVRRALAERIEGSTTEVESVLRAADSKLELSFERLLSP